MHVKEWYLKWAGLAQTIWEGLEYAFLSEDDRQCGPFVYCKEFLVDAVWSQINNTPISIYGFHFNPNTDPPVCLTSCRILLRNRHDKEGFDKRIRKMLKFINAIEEDMGWNLSTLEKCDNSPNKNYYGNVYLLVSPANWLHAPPLVSMLTLLIRSGMAYDGKLPWWVHLNQIRMKKIKVYQKRDADHLGQAWSAIVDLVETKCARLGSDIASNWPPVELIEFWWMHEASGIVSLSTGAARRVNRDWYRKRVKYSELPAKAIFKIEKDFLPEKRYMKLIPIYKEDKQTWNTHYKNGQEDNLGGFTNVADDEEVIVITTGLNVAEKMKEVLPLLKKGTGGVEFPDLEPEWLKRWDETYARLRWTSPTGTSPEDRDKFREEYEQLIKSHFPGCGVKIAWYWREIEVKLNE